MATRKSIAFICATYFQDPDDLPFRKGEVLTVVSKDEEQWWTARNALGQTGSIPVPYIAKVRRKVVGEKENYSNFDVILGWNQFWYKNVAFEMEIVK